MKKKATAKAQSAIGFLLRRKARAQSAMEFLMTYGWAILIMLVVIAVLFYLGIFNPRNVAPNSLTLPAGFSAHDYAINQNGGLVLDLGNGQGHPVTITGIACSDQPVSSNPNNAGIFMDSGTHAKVSNGEIPCSGTVSGEFYKGKVYIWYSVEGSGFDKKAVGDISYRVPGGGAAPPTATSAASPTPGGTPGETPEPTVTSTPQGPSGTPVNGCTTLSSGGDYYISNNIDVTDPSQLVSPCISGSPIGDVDACICITADSVSLDGDGKTISNSAGGVSIGVSLFDADGTTVHGINVEDFVIGIGGGSFSGPVSGGVIANNSIEGGGIGIAAMGISGAGSTCSISGNSISGLDAPMGNDVTAISTQGVSDCEVRDNQISLSGSYNLRGFNVESCQGTVYQDNVITAGINDDPDNSGFKVQSSAGNSFIDNVVSGLPSGFLLRDGASGNNFTGNNVIDCISEDFSCEGTTGAQGENEDGGGNICDTKDACAWVTSCGPQPTATPTLTPTATPTATPTPTPTPTIPPSFTIASSIHPYPRDVGLYGNDIFWVSDSEVGKAALDGYCLGEACTRLLTNLSGAAKLTLHNDFVYVAECNGGKIHKIPVSGGEDVVLASGLNCPTAVAVYGDNVYWAEFHGDVIRRCPISGGAYETIASGLDGPNSIAVDSANVYWTESTSSGAVRSASVSSSCLGAACTTLRAGLNYPRNLILYNNQLYWSDGTKSIHKIGVDGADYTTLITAEYFMVDDGLAVDSTHAYWAECEFATGAVRKVPINGGAHTTLLSGFSYARVLDIDDVYVYVANDNGVIRAVPK